MRQDRCLLLRQDSCLLLRQDRCLLLRQDRCLPKTETCLPQTEICLPQREICRPHTQICLVSTCQRSQLCQQHNVQVSESRSGPKASKMVRNGCRMVARASGPENRPPGHAAAIFSPLGPVPRPKTFQNIAQTPDQPPPAAATGTWPWGGRYWYLGVPCVPFWLEQVANNKTHQASKGWG